MVPKTRTVCRRVSLNITSLQSRVSTSRSLHELYPKKEEFQIPWRRIINQVCNATLKRYQSGNKIEEIWPEDEIESLPYLIYPILPLGVPTILFGLPG